MRTKKTFFQEPVMEKEVEKSEILEEEIDSELFEVIEMTPTTDFHFPEDLTNFYPKTTRDKVETNVAAMRLVKALEGRRTTSHA